MIIFTSIILFAIGILIFNPLQQHVNGDKNCALLWLSVYLSVCITVVTLYCHFNDSEQFYALQNDNNVSQIGNSINLKISDHKAYDIKINDLSEYDYKNRDEIFETRLASVKENEKFISQNYTPNLSILNVVDGKPWWGTEGIVCKGDGEVSTDGLSRESSYGNNPLILINFSFGRLIRDVDMPYCKDEWPMPTSLTIKPSKKLLLFVMMFQDF